MTSPDTIDTFLDEHLSKIFAYGIDWTEYKDKSDNDHEVSTFAGKIKQELKDGLKASIKQFIENRVKEGRVDEINSWFDMPKHYPGEEYRDEPFAKVRCKAPNKVQYYTLDSTFTWCLKNRIAVLTESKGD